MALLEPTVAAQYLRIRRCGRGTLTWDWRIMYLIEAMPTYEYACSKCGHQFDIFQAITQKALTVCPKEKCSLKRWGKGKVKRAIGTGAGIIFKGSGFYVTDYRSEGYKEAAKKESPPAVPSTSGDGKPSAKAETKPAPQSESKAAKPKSDGK